MRHWTGYLFVLLLSLSACAQTKKVPYADSVALKKGYTLIFLHKEERGDLYSQPRIRAGNSIKAIEGFDENNFCSSGVKLSPDGNYLVMDNIIRGYVYRTESDSVLHENYSCVIVDLNRSKVIHYMQSECDGNWNPKNEWISDGKTVFP